MNKPKLTLPKYHVVVRRFIVGILLLMGLGVMAVFAILEVVNPSYCKIHPETTALIPDFTQTLDLLEPIVKENVANLTKLATVQSRHDIGRDKVVFSPNGNLLAMAGKPIGGSYDFDCTNVWIWEFRSGENSFKSLRLSPNWSTTQSVTFNLESDLLLLEGPPPCWGDDCYTLWDIYSGDLIIHYEHLEFVRFPGKNLLSYRRRGELDRHLWDYHARQEIMDIPIISNENARLFNPDNTLFVTTPTDTLISLWDVETETKVFDLERHKDLRGSPADINTLLFSPDGKWLISSVISGVFVWNIETGNLQLALYRESFHDHAREIGFTKDNQKVAFSTGIWDLDSADLLVDLDERVFSGFGVDETIFVTMSKSSVDFFDTETTRLLHSPNITGQVLDVDFSPDGTLIAIVVDPQGTKRGGYVELWGIPAS